MDRAFASGASGSAPSAPSSPSIGFPTSGNAGTGIQATKPGAYWYHMVTEEILSVVSEAGITFDQTKLDQLLKAIRTVAPGVVGAARNVKMAVSAASALATLTADEIVVETVLGGAAYRLVGFNKTINLATTGAGGMDTGSAPASGYVALYAIYNPTTKTSALLAVNATSSAVPNVYGGANMPAGYTASALLSVWPTNASSQFTIGAQRDRKIARSAVAVFNAVSASFTSASLSAAVPPNAISVGGIFHCITNTAGGGTLDLASDISGSGFQSTGVGGVTNTGVSGTFENLPIVTQQTFYYRTLNMGSADATVTSYSI